MGIRSATDHIELDISRHGVVLEFIDSVSGGGATSGDDDILIFRKARGIMRGEGRSRRRRKGFRDMGGTVFVLSFPEGVSLDSVAILDEEINDGGGEAGFNDERGGA